jgi:carboxymethylenebutenolidase
VAELPYWSRTEKPGYINAATRWVELPDGGRAFVGSPTAGSGPYPGIVIGHERYGLVLDSLDVVAMFAAYGYVAIAPDMAAQFSGDLEALTRGQIPPPWDNEIVETYLAHSYDYLAALPEVDSQRISAIGFCASGGWGWLLARVRPSLRAAVCYYGGDEYDEALMEAVRCPMLYVFGEKDHTQAIEDVLRFRDEAERHNHTIEVRLVKDMPHGWLNDTMVGRYRQKEAQEAWEQIFDFLRRVDAGEFAAGRVNQRFEAEFSLDYDFKMNVRWGQEAYPEPSPNRMNALKQAVAEGRAPRSELDAQIALYPEYYARHPEELP